MSPQPMLQTDRGNFPVSSGQSDYLLGFLEGRRNKGKAISFATLSGSPMFVIGYYIGYKES